MGKQKTEKQATIEKDLDINLTNIILNSRQLCDIELILNEAFKPINGFLNKSDYESVLDNMRLQDGAVWPIPINLDLSKEQVSSIKGKEKIALRDQEGFLIAILTLEDIWEPDKEKEAIKVYGTKDTEHPGVANLFNSNEYYVTGELKKINLPTHHDFIELRHSPGQVKENIKKLKNNSTIAFQTRNPIHRAHQELIVRSMKELNANILIHPVVGMTKTGDINHYTRVNCYKQILNYLPEESTLLSLIPLAMRMAGPREAVWHALIRKNYGCSHLIVGRDHAGPGNKSNGQSFYGPYEAQELLLKYEREIDIKMVPFKLFVYVEEKNNFYEFDKIPNGLKGQNISGTELREKLTNGEEIPTWFTYPEISEELKKVYPSKDAQGITLFFTGLSGSGKSTIGNALMSKLLEIQKRKVTLLDGDIVRMHLSSELGFSKEHRDLNITRIGFVASEITKNGGIAICAPIAPYEEPREANKRLINQHGNYIEVYISTPLETCEKRDVKGLYEKARLGIIKGFTGIDDPYESPLNPNINIDTTDITVEEATNRIITYLESTGLI